MSGRGNGGFAAVMAAVFLLAGVVVTYVDGAIFDSGDFANHSIDALDDDAVRAEISTEIANALIPQGTVASGQADEAFQGASDELFDDPAFRSIVRSGVTELHHTVFDQDGNDVGVQLGGVGDPVRQALQQSSPELAAQISPDSSVTVLRGNPPAWLLDAARAADSVQFLGTALLLLAGLMAVISLAIARFKSVAITTFGITLAIGAAILIVSLLASKAALLSGVDDDSLKDALSGVWSAFLGGLQTDLILLGLAGLVIPLATRLIRIR